MLPDESDEFDKEEYEKLGSESGPSGTYGTNLRELLCGLAYSLGVTLYDDESCDGERGSLVLPYKNISEACTEACTRACTGDANIFSMAQILAGFIIN